VSFEPGHVIDGKYRIVRVLGTGGMGAVYEGENIRIGRRVAIKVLHAEAAVAPDLRRRFEREARVAAKIGSVNICDVLDLGDLPSGHAYLVMEYLEGETLDDLMTREPRLQAHEISPIVVQLLDGLSAMHGASIVHRDLKPANVFLANSGVVKILDFGISKFQVQTDEMAQQTQTGALLGTPLYMSPEQSRGVSTLDNRSDIYSVGVMLYRALSGQHCFEAENLPQLLFKTALEEPIPLLPRVDAIDQSFVPIVEKAMAKAPGDRYATAREFRDAIDVWLRTHHPEVVLPQAPARYDGVLEASGSRGRLDASGAHPRLGGSGARPRFESQGGGTPTSLPNVPTAPPVVPAPAPAPAAVAEIEGRAHDTASSWEKVPGAAERGSELALAQTSLSMPSEVTPARPPRKRGPGLFVGVGFVALAVVVGAGFALRKGGPSEANAAIPKVAPAVESVVAVQPGKELPTPAKETVEASPPATGAPSVEGPVTAVHAAVPAGNAKVAPKASVAPSAAAPPPHEASSASKPGRKIRTEL
jgi:eukaryotic-like serine/threonine-protein kinase